MALAHRTKVRPLKPKVRPLTNAEDMIGLSRRLTTPRLDADRVDPEERGAEPLPCSVIAALARIWPLALRPITERSMNWRTKRHAVFPSPFNA
jgi:hypothetical protein